MSIKQRQHDVNVCDQNIMNDTANDLILPAGSSTNNIQEDNTQLQNKEYIIIKSKK